MAGLFYIDANSVAYVLGGGTTTVLAALIQLSNAWLAFSYTSLQLLIGGPIVLRTERND